MSHHHRPRCVPITNDQGQTIGYGRASGPLTDQDRAAVESFARYLTDRWAADHPGQGDPAAEVDYARAVPGQGLVGAVPGTLHVCPLCDCTTVDGPPGVCGVCQVDRLGRPDPVAQVDQLGADWSPDMDAYAAGQLDPAGIRCALCQAAPCACPPFGTPEYLALVARRHGGAR